MRVFLVLFTLNGVLSLDIVVYLNLVAQSHLHFTSTLINELTQRGHTVDLIVARLNDDPKSNGSHNARTVLSAGFPEGSPWSKLHHLTSPFNIGPVETMWFRTTSHIAHRMSADLCHFVLSSASISAHLSSHSYDVALVSNYDGCPFVLLHRHGVSRVLTFSAFPLGDIEHIYTGLPRLPVYNADNLHRFPSFDPTRFFDRARNFLRILWLEHTKAAQISMTDHVARQYYGQDFPSSDELGRKNIYDFVNSNSLLEEPSLISHRLKFIGGIGFQPAKPITDKFYTDLLERSGKGVILISFGSQVHSSRFPPSVVDSFLETARSFPQYTFVWKYDLELPGRPNNLLTVKWLPQNDLLQDSRVVAFITHAGMNSLIESSFSGVPLLCIPLFADQVHNSQNAVRLGTGLKLHKTNVTRETMKAAMEELLNNQSYRMRAKEMAQMLRETPDQPKRTFIEAVEFAAKANDLDRINFLPAGRFNLFIYNGYDIVLVFFTALLVILYAGFRLTALMLSYFSRSGKQKIE